MKVSVSITTHNREKYIVQALESVLMQEVNFNYEIVIGEDCSTDGTRDIVLSFQENYPDKIRVLLHEKNLGMVGNLEKILLASQGEYIALLDDDDYWTSPQKLQKQVDFLDNHPECTVCFHDSRCFYEDGSGADYFINLPDSKEIFTLEDLKPGPFIPTSSTMFRRGLFDGFPNWFHEMIGHDWPLHILNALHGDMGYINEVMSATRIHGGGEWNGRNEIEQLKYVINDYKVVTDNLDEFKKSKVTRSKLAKFYFDIASKYENQEEKTKAIKYLVNSLSESVLNPLVSKKFSFKLLMKIFANFFSGTHF